MGTIVNPISYRLGYSKVWTDAWFAKKRSYPVLLNTLYKLKLYIYYILEWGFLSYGDYYYSHSAFELKNAVLKVYIYLYDSYLGWWDRLIARRLSFGYYYRRFFVKDRSIKRLLLDKNDKILNLIGFLRSMRLNYTPGMLGNKELALNTPLLKSQLYYNRYKFLFILKSTVKNHFKMEADKRQKIFNKQIKTIASQNAGSLKYKRWQKLVYGLKNKYKYKEGLSIKFNKIKQSYAPIINIFLEKNMGKEAKMYILDLKRHIRAFSKNWLNGLMMGLLNQESKKNIAMLRDLSDVHDVFSTNKDNNFTNFFLLISFFFFDFSQNFSMNFLYNTKKSVKVLKEQLKKVKNIKPKFVKLKNKEKKKLFYGVINIKKNINWYIHFFKFLMSQKFIESNMEINTGLVEFRGILSYLKRYGVLDKHFSHIGLLENSNDLIAKESPFFSNQHLRFFFFKNKFEILEQIIKADETLKKRKKLELGLEKFFKRAKNVSFMLNATNDAHKKDNEDYIYVNNKFTYIDDTFSKYLGKFTESEQKYMYAIDYILNHNFIGSRYYLRNKRTEIKRMFYKAFGTFSKTQRYKFKKSKKYASYFFFLYFLRIIMVIHGQNFEGLLKKGYIQTVLYSFYRIQYERLLFVDFESIFSKYLYNFSSLKPKLHFFVLDNDFTTSSFLAKMLARMLYRGTKYKDLVRPFKLDFTMKLEPSSESSSLNFLYNINEWDQIRSYKKVLLYSKIEDLIKTSISNKSIKTNLISYNCWTNFGSFDLYTVIPIFYYYFMFNCTSFIGKSNFLKKKVYKKTITKINGLKISLNSCFFFKYFNTNSFLFNKYLVDSLALKKERRAYEGKDYKTFAYFFDNIKHHDYLIKGNIIRGYKFHLVGRFSKKQRASSVWYKQGRLNVSDVGLNIDYGTFEQTVDISKCNTKVWMYTTDLRTLYNIELIW